MRYLPCTFLAMLVACGSSSGGNTTNDTDDDDVGDSDTTTDGCLTGKDADFAQALWGSHWVEVGVLYDDGHTDTIDDLCQQTNYDFGVDVFGFSLPDHSPAEGRPACDSDVDGHFYGFQGGYNVSVQPNAGASGENVCTVNTAAGACVPYHFSITTGGANGGYGVRGKRITSDGTETSSGAITLPIGGIVNGQLRIQVGGYSGSGAHWIVYNAGGSCPDGFVYASSDAD